MSTTAPERTDSAHAPSTAPSLPLPLTSDPVMAGASRLFTGPRLTRIAPGTYVPAQEWKEARPDLRHLTLIRAALAKTRGDIVLLGVSAAVWLGLPLVGSVPMRVQCLRLSEARSHTALLQRHRRPGLGGLLDDTGTRTSSVADTVVDLARWGGLTQGVCAMDAEHTVWDERQRELTLIRAGYDVARWTWKDAWPDDAPAMCRELARHGIHPTGVRW
ncbi:hypothetical protein [uncultured Actinomyces sp.]|uniref:hypothetical protein n=1 Tax=uncultured Actinomyces sp. TaxID=249061 RepID=UPI0028D47734|nr:hypothetical protein [uncultured Actinomyces sp.]